MKTKGQVWRLEMATRCYELLLPGIAARVQGLLPSWLAAPRYRRDWIENR